MPSSAPLARTTSTGCCCPCAHSEAHQPRPPFAIGDSQPRVLPSPAGESRSPLPCSLPALRSVGAWAVLYGVRAPPTHVVSPPEPRTWRDSPAAGAHLPAALRLAPTSASSRLISSMITATSSPTASRTASHARRAPQRPLTGRLAFGIHTTGAGATGARAPPGLVAAASAGTRAGDAPADIGGAADVLAITGAWMGNKPAPADPARSLAAHRDPPTNRRTSIRLQRFVNRDVVHPSGRVNSR